MFVYGYWTSPYCTHLQRPLFRLHLLSISSTTLTSNSPLSIYTNIYFLKYRPSSKIRLGPLQLTLQHHPLLAHPRYIRLYCHTVAHVVTSFQPYPKDLLMDSNSHSPYIKQLPKDLQQIDVYDVLTLFDVTNPALQTRN